MSLDHSNYDIVAYTDGGCHNSGPCWGGAGTYIETKEKEAFGFAQGMVAPSTNNIAELMGYVNFLDYCIEHNVKTALVYLDSQYVLKGATQYIKGWERRGWVKADGTAPANLAIWQDINKKQIICDTKIEYKWVKGHSGVHGNEMADELATRGKELSEKKDYTIYREEFTHPDNIVVEPGAVEGKVKKKPSKLQPNKGLTGRYQLGITNRPIEEDNGWYVYNSCNLPSNPDAPLRFIGAMSSDYHESVTFTRNKCPVLEKVADLQSRSAPGGLEIPFVYHLDQINSKRNWARLTDAEDDCIGSYCHNVILKNHDEHGNMVPVMLTEYRRAPALISFAIENICYKNILLRDIINGQADHLITRYDVTGLFFDVDKKGKHTVKKELTGIKILHNEMEHNGQQVNLKMGMGLAVPTRNNIAALGKQNETMKVELIMHDETPSGCRWSILFTGDQDVVMCDSPYACRIFYK